MQEVFTGDIAVADDGTVSLEKSDQYNAFLRGGQAGRVEDCIAEASDVRTLPSTTLMIQGLPVDNLAGQFDLVTGQGAFAAPDVRRAFTSALCKYRVQNHPQPRS